MQAARGEFAGVGYAGARVAKIAARAGVNKQLIFYYFGSKQGLYRAALSTAVGEMALTTSAPTPQASASGLLRETIDSVFARLAGRVELLDLLFHSARPEGQSAARAFAPPLNQIRDAISAGQGVGLFRDDIDPNLLALQATVLLIGYLALEPALLDADRVLSRDKWRLAVADTLTRAMAW